MSRSNDAQRPAKIAPPQYLRSLTADEQAERAQFPLYELHKGADAASAYVKLKFGISVNPFTIRKMTYRKGDERLSSQVINGCTYYSARDLFDYFILRPRYQSSQSGRKAGAQ
ncbi:hypothetical protein ACK12G_20820 [Mycolicibacterium wolinskyi]|uniref:hypothetical protein n=1 Tax=Mycolicibacterium wolinskyi TaxID=59750 RepID=UPI0039176914